MFCKECGTENIDNALKCKKCNILLNSNLPLDGSERIKIIIVLLLLLIPPFCIIGIIILASYYLMKKDKNFMPILKAKKYMKIFIILFGIYWIPFNIFDDSGIYSFESLFEHIEWNVRPYIFGLAGIIFLIISILIWLIDNFYFKILFDHKEWIIDNNLFADSKNEKSILDVLTKEIKNKPLDSINELLKWAELKEKGLITEEEFTKAKEKILEGKL